MLPNKLQQNPLINLYIEHSGEWCTLSPQSGRISGDERFEAHLSKIEMLWRQLFVDLPNNKEWQQAAGIHPKSGTENTIQVVLLLKMERHAVVPGTSC